MKAIDDDILEQAGLEQTATVEKGNGQEQLGEAERKLQEENDRLRDQVLRLKAEFDNYRRRTARDWEKNRDRAAAEVFRLLLPTLDHLEHALRPSPAGQESDEVKAYRRGIELIYTELGSTLSQEGLEQIDAVGKPFDPDVAEAVGVVPSTEEKDLVVEVLQAGWTFRGQLLRPARVFVSSGSPGEPAGSDEDAGSEPGFISGSIENF